MRKPLFLLLFAVLLSSNMYGQSFPLPCDEDPTTDLPPCLPGPPGVPIDSGLSFLLIAGAAYGYKKLKGKK